MKKYIERISNFSRDFIEYLGREATGHYGFGSELSDRFDD